MLQAITNRHSTRKYKNHRIQQSTIVEIIRAGTLAPSSKNRQPWEFIVISGNSKEGMLLAMEKGLEREKCNPLLPKSAKYLKGAEYTLNIMRQAPYTIFIINTLGMDINISLAAEERFYEICNAQSIGAAIENMTLTATEFGLGSLWICDTYFAYEELKNWLDIEGELYAAMTIGYADEAPAKTSRKDLQTIIKWRD